MKNVKKSIKLALFIMSIVLFSTNTYSTTIQVMAVSSPDNMFTPANINATVGDTILWTRGSGSHTTTCDNSEFTTLPVGALPWNSPLTSSNPTFRYVIRTAGLYSYKCEPHEDEMRGTINAIVSSIIPLNGQALDYMLNQNYPNPFNPETVIKFSIPGASQVTMKIYNTQGQEVDKILNEHLNAGTFQVKWDAVQFPAGVYYYKIQAGEFIETKKMLLVK